MKKNAFLSLLFSVFSFAQPVLSGNVSFPPDPYNEQVFGDSQHNIYYTYEVVRNIQDKPTKKSGLTLLQINPTIVKYTDEATIKADSLLRAYAKLDKIGMSEMNILLQAKHPMVLVNNLFIKNKEEKTITIQNVMGVPGMEYTLPLQKLPWKLTKEKKEILGYAVQKATTSYGGREWTAWFANSVPLPFGPYIFGGLPGLILEVYDAEDEHHFTATGMDNKPQPIYKQVYPKTIETTQEKAQQALKNAYKRKKVPYNPIEKQ